MRPVVAAGEGTCPALGGRRLVDLAVMDDLVGHANAASAPRSLEFIVMKAPPNALRRITVTRGVVAAANARRSSAPCLITPAASWRVPGMNPGVSTNTTSGTRRASHVRTNFAPFCDAL